MNIDGKNYIGTLGRNLPTLDNYDFRYYVGYRTGLSALLNML